uniref:Uncharacterized protein n=1 Tax=Parascaris univalens TaxID=6257 RepID=A0A915C4X4_PARUN
MSRIDVRLAFIIIAVVACTLSEDRFPRSPRPPGVEIARLGEAKLTEVDKVSSQIGDNIESSFTNNRDIASLRGQPTDVRNGEEMVVLNGPVGPPRNLDHSVGAAPSMPLPPSGSRNLGSAFGTQRPGTFPTQSVWFPKELREGQSGSSAALLGPARSFDVDFVSSEIPFTDSLQTSSPRQVHVANKESPSDDEVRTLFHLREGNSRTTLGNMSGRIEGSQRMVDGETNISRKPDPSKPGPSTYNYENTALKYFAENAGFYDGGDYRVIPPLWRRRAHRRHWRRNEWSHQGASYYRPQLPLTPWQILP